MAINEYSDTVIEDINNNHKEVLFLYDMLNDKHVTIRNTVTEVEKTMGEVTQTAKDIEISAKEAAKEAKDSEETVRRMTDITNRAEKTAQITAQNMEMDVRHIVEDMIRGKVEETMEKTAVPMIQERVDEILEDAALLMEQQPKILIDSKTAESVAKGTDVEENSIQEDKKEERDQTKAVTLDPLGERGRSEDEFVQGIVKNAPKVVIEGEEEGNLSYYIVEPEETESTVSAMETAEEPDLTVMQEIMDLERAVAMEVMQGAQMKQRQEEGSEKVSAINETDKVRSGLIAAVDRTEETDEKEKLSDHAQKERVQKNDAAEKRLDPTAEEWTKTTEENFIKSEKVNDDVQKGDFAAIPQEQESRNSNEKILALHREGMSNVAIAKELGLGVGEVKLVIDLFKGM